MKLSQEKRLDIINKLMPMKANVPSNLRVGDVIKFKYMYNKIKINGKGIIIRLNDKGIAKGIHVFCKKEGMIVNLHYSDESLFVELVLSPKKRVKKSHLNHIVNK